MRILMLCPIVSSSSFITTYPYAKILSKKHDVKIVGPLFSKKRPYIVDKELDFEFVEPIVNFPIQIGMLSLLPKNYLRLLRNDYDVVHAFKLLPHTAPAAAMAVKKTKKPFVLTIDDYDVASPKNFLKQAVLKWSEKFYKNADAITVSSTFLQKIYGGEVIYQVPNEYAFLKRKHNGKMIRERYKLEDKIVVLYAGTFYPHKGVDVLIKAVQSLRNDDVVLLLVGNGRMKEYQRIAGKETVFTGEVPLEKIPDFVDACDIYAIPTKDTLYARAEIPAKIFEAMMMGKAIVASRLSDIPTILAGGRCGLLTKPGSISEMAEAIQQLANDKKLRKKLGHQAKKRYFKNYSYKKIGEKIEKTYSKVLE
jgi:glycosyltransferase involved in cell wall biosynthesis